MTQFLTQSSPIPPYMAFPRFLLDKDGLNETAKILYTILLDRARLSQKNDGWTDEQGHVFIFFPIKSLAETMHKSEMSVKTALNALEKENLIARKRQGAGFPNRIYVKYPPEALNQTDRIFSVMGIVSDRCELNRQIRADNKLLRELKKQVQKLMKAVKENIPALASALETLRDNMIFLQYQLIVNTSQQEAVTSQKNLLADLLKYSFFSTIKINTSPIFTFAYYFTDLSERYFSNQP